MPSKNKPKRLDRQRNVRVARRKQKQRELLRGFKRNRKKREKVKVVNDVLRECLLNKNVDEDSKVKKALKKKVSKVKESN